MGKKSTPAKAWIAAAIFAALAGGLCFFILQAHNSVKPEVKAADFQWSLRAARDLLSGQDPYRYEPGPHAIPYPLPAALAAMPLAWIPDVAAGSIFFGLSVLLLAYGIIRSGEEWRLAMLLSWSFVYSLLWVQWTPLICALWFLPEVAAMLWIKPNITLPLLVTHPWRRFLDWKALLPGAVLLVGSLVWYPTWPLVWYRQLSTYQGISPPIFAMPLGPLVLLSLLAWKDRRAWLLVAMACVPQRMVYDQLPILLAAGSRGQLWVLIAASWVNCAIFMNGDDGWGSVPFGWQNFLLLTLYLPAVVMVAWPAVTMKVHARLQSRQASLGIPDREGRDWRTSGGVHRRDNGEVQPVLPDVPPGDAQAT